MRNLPVRRAATLAGLAAAIGIAACDMRTTAPQLGGIGGTTATNTGTTLTISPSQVSLSVGTTAQLSTNAGSSQTGQLQWFTSNSNVATVSGTGLVTAFAAGTATITARLLSDTAHVASATVLVTSP